MYGTNPRLMQAIRSNEGAFKYALSLYRSSALAGDERKWRKIAGQSRDWFGKFSARRGGGATPHLLSMQNDVTKLRHNEGATTEYEQVVQYLPPSGQSGVNFCPHSTRECVKACLWKAGRLGMSHAQTASYIRGRFFIEEPIHYAICLVDELHRNRKRIERKGRQMIVRLNGTSDIPWWLMSKELFATFHDVRFQDYTKYPVAEILHEVPENLFLIQSAHEQTDLFWLEHTAVPVAVAFKVKPNRPLPVQYLGKVVLDGDKHDMRVLDAELNNLTEPYIVGLRMKGRVNVESPFFHSPSGY